MTDKAIRSAKLTAAGILDKARARTAVTRAGGQIAPSKYLPNVPRQVHADGGRENGQVVNLGKEKLVRSITKAVDDVKSGAHQENMDRRAYKLHESGHLPLQIGTKVTPPQGWDMPSELHIHGYWQDILHPDQHGYKLKSENGDVYEVQHQMHSGQNPYVFGGGFKAYSGPVRNRAGYSDEAMASKNPILPTRTPEQSAQIDKEYDQLFGNDPDITKADGGRVGYEDGGDVGGTAPKNTVKAYKLFKRKKDGNIYPLFVNANKPVPIGQWLDAEEGPQGKSEGKVKSSLGDLAYRPGWHAGDLPVATHIGGKSRKELTAPDYRPDDHVWAEVEMPNDVDWQSVANSRMRHTASGKPILNTAHITDQLPKGGFYRYKTNPNMTGNWLIGGSMKVNRILQDDEVKQINDAAGTADLPRMPDITKAEGGSVTDTDEFRTWFGNSVTHTNGEPHVFYTGTSKDKDFTSFNVGRHGAWFTRDPAEASQYAERNDSQGYKHEAGWKLTPTNTASRVIPAYVKAENPYTGDLPDEVLRSNYKAAQSDWFDTLRRKGHDAWVPARYNGDLVVALKEPQQIKSIFNNGNFDPNQKHMNKAGGGEVDVVKGNNQNGVEENEVGTAPFNLAPRAQAGGLPNARGIRGSIGVLQAQNEASLEGLPTKVSIPLTGGSVSAGHDPRIRQIARDYMASTGLPYNPPTKYAKVDPKRASRIAAAYDEMADNASDPLTKASYGAMIKETMAQYHAAKNAGFKAEFWSPDTEEDPYKASPRLATEDVRNNHHMWVYPTRSGYGSDGPITAKELEENPLLQDSGETWNGQPATVNDIFRAVHDYYGHAKEGVGFRGDGEENAWRSHASMYSPLARMAMTSETRGQNSWLNYGVHGEKNRNARTEDTVFAPQKVGILPHWAHHEGAEDFMGPEEVNAMAAVRKVHGRASGGSVDAALALTRRFTKDGKAATVALKPKGK